jgi:hypothetical protein
MGTKSIKGTICKAIICKVIENFDDSPCGKVYIIDDDPIVNAINHLKNCHNITPKNVSKVCT